jgi:hypothetical protein
VPLAVDLAPADIANPLGQFQAIRLNKDDIGDLLTSMSEVCSTKVSSETLRKTVEKWWPDLEAGLEALAERKYDSAPAVARPARSDRELLEEVLDSVRGIARRPAVRPAEEEDPVQEAIKDAMRGERVTSWWMKPTPRGWQVGLGRAGREPSMRLLRRLEAVGEETGADIEFVSGPLPQRLEHSEDPSEAQGEDESPD